MTPITQSGNKYRFQFHGSGAFDLKHLVNVSCISSDTFHQTTQRKRSKFLTINNPPSTTWHAIWSTSAGIVCKYEQILLAFLIPRFFTKGEWYQTGKTNVNQRHSHTWLFSVKKTATSIHASKLHETKIATIADILNPKPHGTLKYYSKTMCMQKSTLNLQYQITWSAISCDWEFSDRQTRSCSTLKYSQSYVLLKYSLKNHWSIH